MLCAGESGCVQIIVMKRENNVSDWPPPVLSLSSRGLRGLNEEGCVVKTPAYLAGTAGSLVLDGGTTERGMRESEKGGRGGCVVRRN